MMVHVYNGERKMNEISLVEFKRKYNSLKLAYNESKSLKIWEVLSGNQKSIKGRDFSKNVQKTETVPTIPTDQNDGNKDIEKKNTVGKRVKLTRQQELKKVLLETMWLNNILGEQSSILNKKCINLNQNISKSFTNPNMLRSLNQSHQL